MNPIAAKNQASWDAFSDKYMQYELTKEKLETIVQNPEGAFAPKTWQLISSVFPSMQGVRVCVPSSGNNHAVFALAVLGARVTSCDIAANQLAHAASAAEKMRLSIDFVQADTMTLEGIPSDAYDFVYTSNGVHVWINDLPSMYRNIARVLRPGGYYALYEIHPFQRPIDGNCLTALKVKKPYDNTGPFEKDGEITFGWRLQDIFNAICNAGLNIRQMEELQPQIDYENPDWIPMETLVEGQGHRHSKQAIERMYDWRVNPQAALPNLFTLLAQKP